MAKDIFGYGTTCSCFHRAFPRQRCPTFTGEKLLEVKILLRWRGSQTRNLDRAHPHRGKLDIVFTATRSPSDKLGLKLPAVSPGDTFRLVLTRQNTRHPNTRFFERLHLLSRHCHLLVNLDFVRLTGVAPKRIVVTSSCEQNRSTILYQAFDRSAFTPSF